MTTIRTYSELMSYETYEERLLYLMLYGDPSEETFGGLRHLNQTFYTSPIWKSVRAQVIVRDSGLDMGLPDRPIDGKIFVHHMNPITPEILVHNIDLALSPDHLICVSFETHQIIHYSKQVPHSLEEVERRPGDTKLW